jgi:hypothetical protein
VDDYATFHGNIEHERKAWQLWPAANRDGNLSPGGFDKNGKQYHLYVNVAVSRSRLEPNKVQLQLESDHG